VRADAVFLGQHHLEAVAFRDEGSDGLTWGGDVDDDPGGLEEP